MKASFFKAFFLSLAGWVMTFSLSVAQNSIQEYNIFTLEKDTVFATSNTQTIRLWGDNPDINTVYEYHWSNGDTLPYTDIRFEGNYEVPVWCRRTLYNPVPVASDCISVDIDTATGKELYFNFDDTVCLCGPVVESADGTGWIWLRDGVDGNEHERCIRVHSGTGFGDVIRIVCYVYPVYEVDDGHHGRDGHGDDGMEYDVTLIFSIPEPVESDAADCIPLDIDTVDGKELHFYFDDTVCLCAPRIEWTDWFWRRDDGKNEYNRCIRVFHASETEDTVHIQCFRLDIDDIDAKNDDYHHNDDSDYGYTYELTLIFSEKIQPGTETDSVLVIFPKYAYSSLHGDTALCLDYSDTLPRKQDTLLTYNLGPYNRSLYTSYLWKDGHGEILGEDSVLHYTFAELDSVDANFYEGLLAVRVSLDSVPAQGHPDSLLACDTCFSYDTIRIRLVRNLYPSFDTNLFLPRDTTLCAHLDLPLRMSDTFFRAFWLDADSVVMPFGADTNTFVLQGKRGLDGYGDGTDTRTPDLYYLRYSHRYCPWTGFDTLSVINLVKSWLLMPARDTLICRDEPVEIVPGHLPVYSPCYEIFWNDGEKDSARQIKDGGEYVAYFALKADYNTCLYDTASDSIVMIWVDPAMTDIHLPADTTFCKDLSVTLDVRVPFASTRYSWEDGPMPDPEEESEEEQDSIVFTSPVKVIKEEGTYNVLLLDSMGCRNRQEISVTIDDCKPSIEIPNVFTPNGDGVNDVLRFKQLEKCTDVQVEIVDRWGQPVLKQKVPTADAFEWNGTMNNKGRRLPDGPYFYMVSYKNLYGKSKVQSGSITILGTSED